MIYFSDIFHVEEDDLEAHGAFNISLVNDLPLFIDPFLLYASDKEEYQNLHSGIIRYLTFLKRKAQKGDLTDAKIARWYQFPEVKQVWFGYSQRGNSGAGLGKDFAKAMSCAIIGVFKDLNEEKITHTSHLEKLGLFQSGVGRDNISDFTCNLIKGYLLEYTQDFAQQYINPIFCKEVSVPKAYFDYGLESWMPKTYLLPFYNGDYVLLTPKDLLTKDETWISFADMKKDVFSIISTIPNEELRDRMNDVYLRSLPTTPKEKDITYATENLIKQFPDFMDYYIKSKEEDCEGAIENSRKIVSDSNKVFVSNMRLLAELIYNHGYRYVSTQQTLEAARERVLFMKDVIENKDGYKMFYLDGRPVKREKDLQLLFKFTWFNTEFDVNAEVNNGRGPVDYKISMGKYDSSLVEFKLASNTKLRQNLLHQVEVYEKANDTKNSLKVIMYFTANEQLKLYNILRELNLDNNPNVILINAIDDKPSASNVKN